MHSVNNGVTSVQKYISSMQKQWKAHVQMDETRPFFLFGPGNKGYAEHCVRIIAKEKKVSSPCMVGATNTTSMNSLFGLASVVNDGPTGNWGSFLTL